MNMQLFSYNMQAYRVILDISRWHGCNQPSDRYGQEFYNELRSMRNSVLCGFPPSDYVYKTRMENMKRCCFYAEHGNLKISRRYVDASVRRCGLRIQH